MQTSSVCLAENEVAVGVKINPSQKDSASWLHLAITDLMKEHNLELSKIDAFAISAGPGSYTGLRVGMAAAKGLCYALKKPLILINTLKMMASAVQKENSDLFCPMIDARRMEVFAAVFDQKLNYVVPEMNLIVNEMSFYDLMEDQTVLFFGNGSPKFQALTKHPRAMFQSMEITAVSMARLSFAKFKAGEFADLAYSQPFYGKDFYAIMK